MMEDDFQYLVFIKCDSVLSEQKKKKLETYLQVRRKSGGGECGPLTAVADDYYCVAFKDQKEQRGILRRHEHVIELSDGPLVFTITDCPPTPSSSRNTFSTEPEVLCKSPEFIPDLNASLSGEPHLNEPSDHNECIDSKKKSLSSVHLHPEEGAALDKRLPPSDYQSATTKDSSFKSLTNDFTRRIVVLGKSGGGKSSLANTLFGKKVCEVDDTPSSATYKCQAESSRVNGRSITLIDTPGFFDTKRSEEEMKKEILKCIIESAPGPHVFLIVLKVDKYTLQEKQMINKITEYFSDETLKFATVLFTHGDQLPKGTTIREFVSKNEDLNKMIQKCGNRCNVIDNKYWNNSQDEYRSNKFQIKELLDTIDKIIVEKSGRHYTHKVLETVSKDLEEEEERLKQISPNLSPGEIQEKAKAVVQEKWTHYLLRVSTDVLLKAFLGGGKQLMKEEPILALGVGLTKAIVAAVGGTGSGRKVGAAEEKDGSPGGTAAPEEPVASEGAVLTGEEGDAVK